VHRNCRIHVWNHFISAEFEFYANNATLLLSSFQVHRHIKLIAVITHTSIARRPTRTILTRSTNHLNPENIRDNMNMKLPTAGCVCVWILIRVDSSVAIPVLSQHETTEHCTLEFCVRQSRRGSDLNELGNCH